MALEEPAMLSPWVNSAVIPNDVGKMIRRATKFNGRFPYQSTFPLYGPDMISIQIYFNADGSMDMKLIRADGSHFWQGRFIPLELTGVNE